MKPFEASVDYDVETPRCDLCAMRTGDDRMRSDDCALLPDEGDYFSGGLRGVKDGKHHEKCPLKDGGMVSVVWNESKKEDA
jgi:hypothetical protein